jgi:S-adenosylmethionine synthetase
LATGGELDLTSRPAIAMEALPGPPVSRRRLEVVERKGIGHPDTICDSLVEAVAVALNAMYLERLGAVAHYNIDKALLIAGQCRKAFGRGQVTQPMEFVLGDRATFEVDGRRLPVETTVHAAVDDWLAAHLPGVGAHVDFRTRLALAPGSAELRSIFAPGAPEVLSNDTSGACGYAPLSPTEELVLSIERFLNGPGFKARFPDTGQDVKVFGVREDDRLAVTVAMPLLAVATGSEAAYFARKQEILGAVSAHFSAAPFEIEWRLNNLDTPGRGSDGVYLTVTGTSAEDADSGQVGRGNRANGIIAFARPTGGEAAPGKNGLAHAGKVYSVFSHHLARLIHARCPELLEVYVYLAARIGEPVDRPWTSVQAILPAGMGLPEVGASIREVVEAELGRMAAFRAELARGDYPVC